MAIRQVFITGATGFIGSYVAEACRRRELSVVGLARPDSFVDILHRLGCRVIVGDMEDVQVLRSGLRGADAVIHLAAATSEHTPDPTLSERVNVGGMRNLIEACQAENVRRVICVSSQSTKRKVQGAYGRTKQQADRLLMESGLDWTILKPTVVYGPGNKGVFARIVNLVQSLPYVPVIGNGQYRIQPTFVEDVAWAVLSCFDHNNSIGQSYDLAGAERFTFEEFVNRIQQGLNQQKKIVHLPVWLALLIARLSGALLSHPPLTRDNVLGVIQETQVDLSLAQQDLGFEPSDFSKGLRRSLPTVRPFFPSCSDRPIRRIGIVGMGKMGVVHASLINVMPQAQLAAVMDVRKGLKSYLRSLGIVAPFYTSLEQMLDEMTLDGVIVCLPPFLNEQVVAVCAKKNLAILLEKPLCTTLEEGQSLVKLAEQGRFVDGLGYMVAHVPIFHKTRQLLREGMLGALRHAQARVYLSQVFSPKKGWRYRPTESGGGVVSVVGSHMLYLLRSFFGEMTAAQARLRRVFSAEVEDEAEGTLTFGKAFPCDFEMSWSRPGFPALTMELEVHGDHGRLFMTNERIVLVKSNSAFDCPDRVIHRWDLPSLVPFDVAAGRYDSEGYYLQDAEFIDCIGSERRPTVGWKDGYQVQQMIETIYAAALKGKQGELTPAGCLS